MSGGDASLFSIHQTSGALSFNSAADFEAPTDGNSDNSYNITVRATDGAKTADQAYTINVSNVSEAPVATNQTLTDIAEDVAAASNNGSAVSALVSGFTDGDDISGGTQAKRGLAIVSVDNTNGTWQYTTDGGSNWSALAGVSASGARLLAADNANHRVRFLPASNYNGSSTFTFRAWDQTTGTAGSTADVSSNGGTTAFSAATATATQTITAVDDAPILGAISNQSLTEDTPATVSLSLTNVDNDTITYAVTGGGASTVQGSISGTTLTLTPAQDYNNSTPVSLTVTATGTNSGLSDTQTFTVGVGAVDDAPVLGAIGNKNINPGDGPLTVNLSATEADGEAVTYSISGGAANTIVASVDNSADTVTFTPASGYGGGTVSFTVTATDANGTTDTETFNVSVNQTPTLDNAISDQTVSGSGAWSYQVPANTFSDPDSDPLTYSATLGDGSALPSWLSFDVSNRIFGGNPAIAQDASPITLKVTATDSGGLTVSDTFTATFSNSNDTPTVANPIADQSQSGGGNWSYQVPANTFSDGDGEILSYSATLANGSPLPIWISFDTTTRIFSGNPASSLNGSTVSLKVTATDGSSATISDSFDLSISNANDAPAVGNAIPDQNHSGSGDWSYQVPANTFSDADGGVLTYSAKQGDNSALPSWLSFDASTRTFNGNPPSTLSSISLKVTATDSDSAAGSDTFILTLSSGNDAPTLVNAIPDQAQSGSGVWSYQIPANTFSDADGDTLTYRATQANGSALPSWLTMDSSTHTLSGNPPTGVGTLSIKVIVTDVGNQTITDTFDVSFSNSNDTPVVANVIPNQNQSGSGVWSYQVPANTFSDGDGEILSYSATLANGSPLPSWISFDTTTRTFSGNPASSLNGSTISLKVTATDGSSTTVSDSFDLSISNANDGPTTGAVSNDSVMQGANYNRNLSTAFSDLDGDTLSYSKVSLPSGLNLDTTTGVISGNVTRPGTYNLTITADDGHGGSSNASYQLRVDAPALPSVGKSIVGGNAASKGSSFSVGGDTTLVGGVSPILGGSSVTAGSFGGKALDSMTAPVKAPVPVSSPAPAVAAPTPSTNLAATDSGNSAPQKEPVAAPKLVVASANKEPAGNSEPQISAVEGAGSASSGTQPVSPVSSGEPAPQTPAEKAPTGESAVDPAKKRIVAEGVVDTTAAGERTSVAESTPPVATEIATPDEVAAADEVAPVEKRAEDGPDNMADGVETPADAQPEQKTENREPVAEEGSGGVLNQVATDSDVTVDENGQVRVTDAQNVDDQPAGDKVSISMGESGAEITQAAAGQSGMTIVGVQFEGQDVEIKLIDFKSGTGSVRYTAQLEDGSELPNWVTIQPDNGNISATPPEGMENLNLDVMAIGSDGTSRVMEVDIDFTQKQQADPLSVVDPALFEQKLNFSQQIAAVADQYRSVAA